MITQARLRELLHYDPDTGLFTRLVARGGHPAGSIAGQRTTEAIQIRVDGVLYLAHRLAWLYVTGSWPAREVDHRDNDSQNNRWSNLRAATDEQNAQNTRLRKDNKSRFKGVRWHRATGKWAAQVQAAGSKTHLGLYDCPAAAHLAYMIAADRMHGEFANFG